MALCVCLLKANEFWGCWILSGVWVVFDGLSSKKKKKKNMATMQEKGCEMLSLVVSDCEAFDFEL